MVADGSQKLLAIVAAGHELGWPGITTAEVGEELRRLEEQREEWKARVGASSSAQLPVLERNLAARLVQGLAHDVPGAMQVFDELVRTYVESALHVVEEDPKAAKALLSKADRMTSETSLVRARALGEAACTHCSASTLLARFLSRARRVPARSAQAAT